MYTDKKRRYWPWAALAGAILVIGILIGSLVGSMSGRHVEEGSAAALKAAVQRSAHQCYAVEGMYPPNLKYLEEHYGLQVNHSKFYISFDAFASNLPPNIRVTPRN